MYCCPGLLEGKISAKPRQSACVHWQRKLAHSERICTTFNTDVTGLRNFQIVSTFLFDRGDLKVGNDVFFSIKAHMQKTRSLLYFWGKCKTRLNYFRPFPWEGDSPLDILIPKHYSCRFALCRLLNWIHATSVVSYRVLCVSRRVGRVANREFSHVSTWPTHCTSFWRDFTKKLSQSRENQKKVSCRKLCLRQSSFVCAFPLVYVLWIKTLLALTTRNSKLNLRKNKNCVPGLSALGYLILFLDQILDAGDPEQNKSFWQA